MVESNFVSPIYEVMAAPIEDVVSQRSNPNSQSAASFRALQMSILNQGLVVPVSVARNLEYDPSTAGLKRPSLLEGTNEDDDDLASETLGVSTQMSNDEIAKYFPLRLIDGHHRSQVIRFGKYYFDTRFFNRAEDWLNGDRIPTKAGPECMAYIAWRANFKIPVVKMELTEVEQMSAEILANSARGSSGLDSMKILVDKLVKSGKTSEWIAENLNINIDDVSRMQQMSGLKSDFNDWDEVSDAWDSNMDNSYDRKLQAFLNRESVKFINTYDGNKEIPNTGTSITIAKALGWDEQSSIIDFENRNK